MQLSLGKVLPSLWEGAPLQTLLLLSAMLLILAQYLQRRKQHRNLPPGPPGLPILGNFLQMDFKNPKRTIQKLFKKYGDVFCTHTGNLTLMIVSGMPLIKEVLVNQDQVFIDRPQVPINIHLFQSLAFQPIIKILWNQEI